MKLSVVAKNTKVLSIEKRTNQDGSINWTELILQKDIDVNTITCDSKLAEQLKVGSSYDFIISISEVPKAYKNGSGAYLENKFKVVGVDVK